MREDIRKLLRDLDAVAARMNAGLGAVALVLTVAVGATLTVKITLLSSQLLLDSPAQLLLGP